jgi:hypothetical protein
MNPAATVHFMVSAVVFPRSSDPRSVVGTRSFSMAAACIAWILRRIHARSAAASRDHWSPGGESVEMRSRGTWSARVDTYV